MSKDLHFQMYRLIDKMGDMGPKTAEKTRVAHAKQLFQLWTKYMDLYPTIDFSDGVMGHVLMSYDEVVKLPASHPAMQTLDQQAEFTIDTMIKNLDRWADPHRFYMAVEDVVQDIIKYAPKRLEGVKKLKKIPIRFRVKNVLLSYIKKRKGKQEARVSVKNFVDQQLLPKIRVKVLKKGMKLYRGTKSQDDDTSYKYYVYMSDNPFAFRYIKGVDVEYLHEYELTRDLYVMDFVSHPDMCRPDFKKMLKHHDAYKRYDLGAKSYHTDPEPSSLMQLFLYQKKRIVGHVSMASADCPGGIPGTKLDAKLKANRRQKRGFPEYIFYNYLPILRGLGWLKRTSTKKVWKLPVSASNDANVEAFYSKFESPKLISPSKIVGKTKKATPKAKSPKNPMPKNNFKLSVPQGKELQLLRTKYTKIRERVKKMDPDTAELEPEERSATVGHYAAYWPPEGCTEESNHYVAYSKDDFPRCYKVTTKKALTEAYRRSKDKRFYGSKTAKLATLQRLLDRFTK